MTRQDSLEIPDIPETFFPHGCHWKFLFLSLYIYINSRTVVLMYLYADSSLYKACSLLDELFHWLIFTSTATYISLDAFPSCRDKIFLKKHLSLITAENSWFVSCVPFTFPIISLLILLVFYVKVQCKIS